MPSGRSKLNFEVGSQAGDKTVSRVVPVDMVLAVGIVDGEGKKSNRLLFRAEGGETFYFMFPKGTEEAMKPAAGWLQEILEREVGSIREPIPEDPVTAIPTGDPLSQ
jgi:hypothetical protein